jgi:thiamine biosynthesis lipoprotein ApbE
VITGEAMTADAVAIGFMVAGRRKSLILAAKSNVATSIAERKGNEYDSRSSDQLELLLVNVTE